MTKQVPSLASALVTLMGVTLRRVMRSRSVWVVILIALLPVFFALAMRMAGETGDEGVAVIEMIVMALLPSVLVASSVGEELEDRTTTYLWSRPLPRWTIIIGKLLALVPVAAVLICGGFLLGYEIDAGTLPPAPRIALAFAVGGAATSAIAASIAVLVPKHGMPLAIVYLVIIDTAIGAIPASLQAISVTRQVRLLAAVEQPAAIAEPLITMAIVATVWLVIAFWRLRRLES